MVSRQHNYRRGFSLVELMVVVTIVVLITATALINHSSFNSTTLLNNLAYDIALSVRQAQAYGVSVRNSGSGNFQAPYGVHFEKILPNSYILFQDLDGGNDYDGSLSGEFVEQYNLRRGHKIADACRLAGVSTFCFSDSSLAQLDITFKRPNPDAIVNGSQSSNACVKVSDKENTAYRTVEILLTGQISIANPGVCAP